MRAPYSLSVPVRPGWYTQEDWSSRSAQRRPGHLPPRRRDAGSLEAQSFLSPNCHAFERSFTL